MINFCTLFDSFYLAKGLALYRSLQSVSSDFHLFVMAFDEKSFRFLKQMECENLTVQWLNNFETPELLAVKAERTRGEYCWTCGPSVIHYFMTTYNLPSLTYIDADMMFYSNPQVLFDEIGDADIAVSPHFIEHEAAGKFCVQFNYFKNSAEGMRALVWWKDCCIEWCYNKYEDGKYGDQGYVEQFPSLFNNVHIMEHRGTGVASWNMNSYSFHTEDNSIIYKGVTFPIVFFHYHGTSLEVHDDVLVMSTKEFDVKHGEQYAMYGKYLALLTDIYRNDLHIPVSGYRIAERSFVKKINFMLRATLRNNALVRWLYYDVLNLRNSG